MNFKHEFSVGPQALVATIMAAVLLVACGSGSGTNTNTINVVPIVIDAGPVPGASEINVAYVSVTVCTPGTSACQTIDHVLLDTGSSGLRLLNSALYSSLNLPPVTSGGSAIGECTTFAVGTNWGSVRYADIYLGGEVARSVPIQDIGDPPGGATAIPTDCSGPFQDTQALLGANGILGVGLFTNDCDVCLTANPPIPATYYTCIAATGCTGSKVTSAQVVQNPVALFSQDNNGVLVTLPVVSAAGTSILNGSLIFGIGTQSNNHLGSATVYAADPSSGNFSTTFNKTAMTSYIDSGSNALFFYDLAIKVCPAPNSWVYCPPTQMTLTATNYAFGSGNGVAVTSPSPTIVNADQLFSNSSVVAGNIGGTSTQGQFAWGLPFFFGRPVFTAISGASTPGGPGPYWAY